MMNDPNMHPWQQMPMNMPMDQQMGQPPMQQQMGQQEGMMDQMDQMGQQQLTPLLIQMLMAILQGQQQMPAGPMPPPQQASPFMGVPPFMGSPQAIGTQFSPDQLLSQ